MIADDWCSIPQQVGTGIQEDLVKMLSKLLYDATLSVISEKLARTAKLLLLPEDIEFLRPPNQVK